MNNERVRNDFDHIARLSDSHGGGEDRYDSFLLSLVPLDAVSVLEVGCGLGRLTMKLAIPDRAVTGVDLSPEMIARARKADLKARNPDFICGDFLVRDFTAQQFDCVISAATLHHMPEDIAVARMVELLRPGGRLVIHDIRSDAGLGERARTHFALAQVTALRLLRTGRLRSPRPLREAWEQHCADEKYLTMLEAEAMATRLLPGARLFYHWLWSYTIAWDKPPRA
ncbi:MAG: class I SAM-dependent methyltransferase [Pyrinomonadaceae bacterium]|nr:class I SAM-dependent methyltransferase [Pyrinomonadaceae bacterium]